MSYTKAIKHFKNHRKDRYYQQCGFSFTSQEKSYSSIAGETATGYCVCLLETGEQVTPIFHNSDDAVDYYRTLPIHQQKQYGIFTDKGMILMR